ncbi:dimethyladenosine transferase 2, mitochondrial-like [Vombatus ursinus]|uniref:rRNA adenine N(6)-methyltransferase n=1 Tax=Vombatus ursinus TaxID=29139 RepID=A0A4X2LIR2_VOMUR|nr:dimethyladenosine transferase 2, mitochondrial-like [Vombatus ursinus]XP_027726606.1 dimethyladenosine transferase 2, mitochondrial-like [Vombatus ursinus]
MWGPVTGLPARLSIATMAGACLRRLCETGPGCLTRPHRLLSQSCLEPVSWTVAKSEASPRNMTRHRLFAGSAKVADTVVQLLQAGPPGAGPRILECNPGPGLITCALLNAGLQVVALESDLTFLPYLTTLKKHPGRQLEVIYCDFFHRDPSNITTPPPAMFTETLFKNLGISKVPWAADVPVKIVGFFPTKTERTVLWKLLYDLYSCSSIYNYGRIELNMFISEKEYKKIISKPGEKDYQTLSVLWQTACEIKLLHMEPLSSFVTFKNGELTSLKSKELKNKHLCFIELTPRRNLFTNNLTPVNSYNFICLVKQCLNKSKSKLIDIFNSWCICDTEDLLQHLKKQKHERIGSLYPEEFKYLFEALESSETFTQKWLYDHSQQNEVAEKAQRFH